jgi:hypothetical protein
LVESLPSTPMLRRRRSAGEEMPSPPRAMIEFSAVGTIAATATTGARCCWAKNSSGSYEMPRSARPAATSLIGSDTCEGWRGVTSSPARRK